MKTRVNFRSVVFQRAYRIVRETGCMFADALKAAWNRYREYKNRIVAELVNRINCFDYMYDYSDDSRVWRRWSNERSSISEILSNIPVSFIPVIVSQISRSEKIRTFINL